MIRGWLLGLVLYAGAIPAQAKATESFAPGHWITSNQEAILEMAPCGPNLCGTIVGIVLRHQGDPMPLDWRGRPQCGDVMIHAAPDSPANDGSPRWRGTVTDPRDGHVYQALLKLDENGAFRMHGYVGLPLFGATQVWPQFDGTVLAGCHVPGRTKPGN